MSRLSTWLQDIEPCDGTLVWCHTTDAYSFRSIVETGICEVSPCSIFKEKLLYLFYGRPAFRLNDELLSKSGVCPIVLAFDFETVAAGKRMFPFDSGAFNKDRFSGWMHPKMVLDDFAMPVEAESPRKHIAAFFGSNSNYLKTKTKEGIKSYAGHFEVEALVNLLQHKGESLADDRRMAVELQLGSPLKLPASSLRAVIFPDELESVDWLVNFVERSVGVIFKSYPLNFNKLSKEYQMLLEVCARDIQSGLSLV